MEDVLKLVLYAFGTIAAADLLAFGWISYRRHALNDPTAWILGATLTLPVTASLVVALDAWNPAWGWALAVTGILLMAAVWMNGRMTTLVRPRLARAGI